MMSEPMVIGHRGASAVAPENTIAAFRRAMNDGAGGVEFDVRLSADGIPVVIHDRSLRRTGLCEGVVERMSGAALAKTKTGSWFNRKFPALAREEYELERLPLLDDVFDLFTSSPDEFERAKLYVELKAPRDRRASRNLVRSVIASVLKYRLENRTTLLSFDIGALDEAVQLNQQIATGILFKPRIGAATARKTSYIGTATRHAITEIALHRLLATRRMVGSAIANNLSVVVWTADSPRWMIRARSWGIGAIITNNPKRMLAATDQR